MMPKNHPCVRDCPDRRPGCNCEKLVKYKRKRKEEKKLKQLSGTVDDYQKNAVLRNRKNRIRRRHRI